MNLKILFLVVLLFSISYADYQKVSIGRIDSYYSDLLSEEQLLEIIKDIEYVFEQQLNINIFDYDNNGKQIDIIYMPPSEIKQNISQSIKTLKIKKIKIENLQESFYLKKDSIVSSSKILEKDNNSINNDIKSLNSYIKEVNNKKIISQDKYDQIKKQIKKMEKNITSKRDKFQQKQIKFKTFLNSYNQKISLYNTLIKQYNKLQRKVETMIKSSKEIKGAAIGYTQTKFKTFFKDGNEFQEKTIKKYMEKIEIYGFDNLNQLKAILAHEIAHLVGVGHVDIKGALMNPILQQNQIDNLELTPADIDRFIEI